MFIIIAQNMCVCVCNFFNDEHLNDKDVSELKLSFCYIVYKSWPITGAICSSLRTILDKAYLCFFMVTAGGNLFDRSYRIDHNSSACCAYK